MPSRLATLALLAALVVAGCVGGPATDATTTDRAATTAATATDSTTAATTETTAATTETTTATTDATRTTRDCYYRSFEVEVRPISPGGVAREVSRHVTDLDFDARQVVQSALSNGSATVTVLGNDGPLEPGEHVRTDESYFRVERALVSEEFVTTAFFELDGPLHQEYDAEAYAAAEEDAVPFEDLAAVDRAAFLAGLPGGERLDDLLSGGGSLAGHYDYAYPDEAAENDSRLLRDGPQFVAFRDTYWRVAFDGWQRGVQRATYRYELNRTTNSADEFGQQAIERLAVDLNETFEGDQRDLLLRALDLRTVSWSGCGESPPAGYKGLFQHVTRLPPENLLVYVSHRGTLYRVQVLQAVE